MKQFLAAINLRELLRPLGQLLLFSLGSALVLSTIVLVLAFCLDQTAVGLHLHNRLHVSLSTYTLVNLPQVVIDGLTIGFVYAAIALGYTMVYGVLEFINFAHSEIFAIGAFVGWKGAVFGMFGGAILGCAWFVAAYFWKQITGHTAPVALPAETPDGVPTELGLGVHVPFGPMLGVAALIYFFGVHHWVDAYFKEVQALF